MARPLWFRRQVLGGLLVVLGGVLLSLLEVVGRPTYDASTGLSYQPLVELAGLGLFWVASGGALLCVAAFLRKGPTILSLVGMVVGAVGVGAILDYWLYAQGTTVWAQWLARAFGNNGLAPTSNAFVPFAAGVALFGLELGTLCALERRRIAKASAPAGKAPAPAGPPTPPPSGAGPLAAEVVPPVPSPGLPPGWTRTTGEVRPGIRRPAIAATIALCVLTGTFALLPLNFSGYAPTCTFAGSHPTADLYVPSNGILYVADEAQNVVLVVNATTHAIESEIGVGCSPVALAYAPSTNTLFVANFYSGNITMIDTLTDKVVGSIGGLYYPSSLAFDPVNGEIYFTEPFGDFAGAIQGAPAAPSFSDFLYSLVGGEPYAVAFDPETQEVAVASAADCGDCSDPQTPEANSLLVGANSVGQPLATVPTGVGARAVAYDPIDRSYYVANAYSSDLTVVNDSTDQATGNISVGLFPSNLIVDPATGNIYVTDLESDPGCMFSGCTVSGFPPSGNVTVVDATTGSVIATVAVGGGPVCLAEDPTLGEVFVTNWGTGTISVVALSSETVVATLTLPS